MQLFLKMAGREGDEGERTKQAWKAKEKGHVASRSLCNSSQGVIGFKNKNAAHA